MRIRCRNPNRATNFLLMHVAHQHPLTPPTSQVFATSPLSIALDPFTIFGEHLVRLSKIKTFAVRPSISLPLYRDVNHPVSKSESCLRHSLKRNEKMGSKPNQHRALTQNFCLSPHGSRPTPSPHPCLFHSPNLLIFLTRNMRAEGDVLSRTTLHPHPFAHSFLNLHPSLHHQPSSHGSKNPPSLTQPQPYIASRTPRDPYAGTHRALAYPGLRFSDRRPVPFFSHLVTALEHRQTSYRKLLVGNTRMGMESPSCSGQYQPFRSLRAGVDSQCNRTGEPLIRTVQNDCRLLTLLRLELVMNVNEYGVCKG